MFLAESANSLIDGPTRAALLDGRSGPIEPHMADLRFARFRAMIDFPIDNQASPDPTAERHIKYRAMSGPSAAQRFSQRGNIRIIIDGNCNAQKLCCPVAQREIGPALDLMRAAGYASSPIQRAPEADAGTERTKLLKKLVKPGFDLGQDARCAKVRRDRETVALQDLPLFVA